jgi:hypothetical protein
MPANAVTRAQLARSGHDAVPNSPERNGGCRVGRPKSQRRLGAAVKHVEKQLCGRAGGGWILTSRQLSIADDVPPVSSLGEPRRFSSSSTRNGTTFVRPTASSSPLVKPVTFLAWMSGFPSGCAPPSVHRSADSLPSPAAGEGFSSQPPMVPLRGTTRYSRPSGPTALTPPVRPIASAVSVDFAGSVFVSVATALLTRRSCTGLGVSSTAAGFGMPG